MKRVRVKICGITNKEDLEAAVDAGADALGFVVDVPQSPRNVSVDHARDLCFPNP
jgi:phosphoribosylanthranilate isomerase